MQENTIPWVIKVVPAVVGNSYITWIAVGTRNGAIT